MKKKTKAKKKYMVKKTIVSKVKKQKKKKKKVRYDDHWNMVNNEFPHARKTYIYRPRKKRK